MGQWPGVTYFCFNRPDEKILSENIQLGALEFLRALFPYWPCLALVLPAQLVILVFQLIEPYHHFWRV